ncbi:MAG: glycosyltransferase [Patescibacteria group bacterium]
MIKVCHVIGRLAYGGAERLLLDICRKIDKDKFQLSIIVLKRDNPLIEQFEDAGVEVKCIEKKGKLDLSLTRRLAEYFKKTKPDIIHTHLFLADYWAGRAARSAGVKRIVSTKHDILSEDLIRDYLGRKARRKCDKVVAISKATREYLVETEKISCDQIEVIYNGIDINKFYCEKPAILEKEGLVIGTVGRLVREKGQKHLIRACRFIKNHDWRLIIVGDGPLKKELSNLAISLGIADRIRFDGEQDDVRPALEEMDVFVLPSISEGLSLVILEAAAAGKVVVATKVGGVPEIIKNKENGLLFKPKSIEQLVGHLNWIDEHREEARKMAMSLQKRVMSDFDINKTIKEYEKLYEELAIKHLSI